MHLFSDIPIARLWSARLQEAVEKVQGASVTQLESDDFVRMLVAHTRIEPLQIDFGGVTVSNREESIPGEMHPRGNFLVDRMTGRSFTRQVITFHVPYAGDPQLLGCIPNPRVMSAPDVQVDGGEISFDIIDFYNDANRVRREADQRIDVIKKQAAYLDENVKQFNLSVAKNVGESITQRQEQLTSQFKVVQSLGYPVKQAAAVADNVVLTSSSHPNRRSDTQWDVFISHASEDKETFVEQLAGRLREKGIRVWYDDFTLKIGDSLRRSIDAGLLRSKFGIVVLSPRFFAKEWPQKELDALVTREANGVKVILPVWLDIDAKEVGSYSPLLADRVAVKADAGIDSVVVAILEALESRDR